MKTIEKGESTAVLSRAIQSGWSWSDFHANAHNEYSQLRELALEEQRNECAYTGLWIGEGTTRTAHLDHFRKKVLYPELTFVWKNLFAAAKCDKWGSDYKDSLISGPRHKADMMYESFWSPLEANLTEKFWYRTDGEIEPHPTLPEEEKTIAAQTIQMYNLNDGELKNRRRSLMRQVRDMSQLDAETVHAFMATAGFSFVVDFELKNR